MNGPALLADHIDERLASILDVWRIAVDRDRETPDIKRLTYTEFVDHVPVILNRVVARLRGDDISDSGGVEHGRMRWSQGYEINEVVRELSLLRTTLSKATFAYARKQAFDLTTLDRVSTAIHEVLDTSLAEAVEQFESESLAAAQASRDAIEAQDLAIRAVRGTADFEKARLRAVLDSLPVGVWVANASGEIVAVNAEGLRFREPRTVLETAQATLKLCRPDGSPLPPDQTPLRRALRGDRLLQEEFLWMAGDQVMPATVNAIPLIDPSDAIVGAVAVIQDIGPWRKIEEQLRHQLHFNAALTAGLGEGIVAVDVHGTVSFLNPAAEQLLKRKASDLVGKPLREAVRRSVGGAIPDGQDPLREVVLSGETRRAEEVFWLGDGSCFPAETTAAPIVIEGQVIGVVEVVRDITRRRRLETDLATTEARYRTIVDQSPVMIWRSTPDGDCDYFNRRWLDFRGRSSEQEAGNGWTEGVHPDDLARVLEVYRDSFSAQKPFVIEYRLLRRDGEYRWITDHGLPYRDSGGDFLGYLGSCIDISDRVELERALKDRNVLAEEASLHKTRLLSALSHDARTPLNSVVLSAQLLEMHIPERSTNAEVEECLRTIRHSVKNVLDLLQDLLDLSKIDAGATPVEATRFDLGPVLAECLGGIEAPARQKGLECRLDPDGLDVVVLESDRSKLKQILGNFLSNALRYTQTGQIILRGRLGPDEVRISVTDTGPGIDLADQPRIFDEFATLANPLRPQGEGTGLGLAICRRLAGLLKGRIDLESTPGQGSTFTLVLPASSVASGPAWEAPMASGTSPTVQTTAGGLIVVAEDDPASRRILSRVLDRLGYRVLEAGNGRDALALIDGERPMAVLMDVNMPVMDGIDATIALRSDPRFRDLPIFALTGDVSTINRRRIGDAGVDGYLEKPLTLDVLRSALENLSRVP